MKWYDAIREIDRQIIEKEASPKDIDLSSIHIDHDSVEDIEVYIDPVMGLEVT